MLNDEKILYVDGKDYHLDEDNAMVIHPNNLGMAHTFEKGIFDKVIIKNSPTSYLKSICFFNIARALKDEGMLELYLAQPISVMQTIEVQEIEANALRGGFTGIEKGEFEEWVTENGKDIKLSNVKLTMMKHPITETKKVENKQPRRKK